MSNSLSKDDLEEFMVEAHKVREMSMSEGWAIISRDARTTIEHYKQAILSVDKNDPKFDELRLQTMSFQKLLDIVEDYEANRKKAEELWMKINLQDSVTIADVDNESPLIERD